MVYLLFYKWILHFQECMTSFLLWAYHSLVQIFFLIRCISLMLGYILSEPNTFQFNVGLSFMQVKHIKKKNLTNFLAKKKKKTQKSKPVESVWFWFLIVEQPVQGFSRFLDIFQFFKETRPSQSPVRPTSLIQFLKPCK